MSASPSGPSPLGRPTAATNGAVPGAHRPRPKTNPLVGARKPVRKPPTGPRPPKNAVASPRPAVNGVAGPLTTTPAPSDPPGQMQEFPLYMTRRALLEGSRHHILRFTAKERVDILNQETFERPVLLHRRDPRVTSSGGNPDAMAVDSSEDLAAAEEREKQAAAKEERRRIREENMAQVAPTGKAHRPPAFQKKTEQVFRTDDTPEAAKASQLRYEEAVPWFLEDFNGKQTYQGTYEAAMSETYLAFRQGGADEQVQSPHFTVYPVEKFYRFREKSKFKHYSLEEVEEKMSKRYKESRWEMNQREADKMKKMQLKEEGGIQQSLSLRRGERGEKREYIKREGVTAGDEDDIDFNLEEEFADDEENPLFEGEGEEVKDAEDRIRKDMLGANAFELVDAKDVEKQDERDKKKRGQEKALQKSIRKALLKRERRNDYESDSDENPYESKSESEDSEAERRKEEEKKKEEEAKAAERAKVDKPPSEASTRGTNTPSGRASKHAAPPMQKSASSSSLKRPGSPNASDMSGNESSRKKQKQSHLSANSTNGPDKARQNSIVRKRLTGAGSGSDTDVSVSGRKMKKQRTALSPNGTPGGSRAGSPDAAGDSRAGSPGARALPPPPSVDEIIAQIPANGVPITQLVGIFKHRISSERKKDFFAAVKRVATVDMASKTVYPKGKGPKESAGTPQANSAA